MIVYNLQLDDTLAHQITEAQSQAPLIDALVFEQNTVKHQVRVRSSLIYKLAVECAFYELIYLVARGEVDRRFNIRLHSYGHLQVREVLRLLEPVQARLIDRYGRDVHPVTLQHDDYVKFDSIAATLRPLCDLELNNDADSQP